MRSFPLLEVLSHWSIEKLLIQEALCNLHKWQLSNISSTTFLYLLLTFMIGDFPFRKHGRICRSSWSHGNHRTDSPVLKICCLFGICSRYVIGWWLLLLLGVNTGSGGINHSSLQHEGWFLTSGRILKRRGNGWNFFPLAEKFLTFFGHICYLPDTLCFTYDRSTTWCKHRWSLTSARSINTFISAHKCWIIYTLPCSIFIAFFLKSIKNKL